MGAGAEGAPARPVLRPGNIVLSSPAPARLLEFWAALTGYVRRELFGPYTGLRDPTGAGPNLTFQETPAPAAPTAPARCHIDLYVAEPDKEAQRAVGLGATVVRRVAEGDVHWVVLADPDGNEFCFVAAIGPDRLR